jgi:hypothetical protein
MPNFAEEPQTSATATYAVASMNASTLWLQARG